MTDATPARMPGPDGDGVPSGRVGLPRWMLPAAVVAFVALSALGALLGFGASERRSVDVVAVAAGETGGDPFTSSVALVDVTDFPDDVQAEIDADIDRLARTGRVLLALGTQPGLYGAPGGDPVCDSAALMASLGEEPDKRATWADAADIDGSRIADEVGAMTAVVLTIDTLVVDHGFADGEVHPRQAVLQAGTAVLVDDTGAPRVRCASGNPLEAPDARSADASGVTAAWEHFDPDRVVVVDPGPPASTFDLRDTTPRP